MIRVSLVIGFALVTALAAPAFADDQLPVTLALPNPSQPARNGDPVVVIVQTVAGAHCHGQMTAPGSGQRPRILSEAIAGSDGKATWSFSLSWGKSGTREITVTCTLGDKTGTLKATFEVQ
jgi:hypothetical protein